MSASRARKIMLAAIAISLLLHLLLAGYLRWPFVTPSAEPHVVKVRQITIARVVPQTPPPVPPRTPAPTPPPARRPAPAVKAKVVPPRTRPRAPKGAHAAPVSPAKGTAATALPAAPASPVPTAAATPALAPCMQHDVTPALTATPAPVDIPAAARASKVSGVAAIAVQLDAHGNVTGAAVAQSSGNAGLDAVALQMARGASYSPALVRCKGVASAYTYTVRFAAW